MTARKDGHKFALLWAILCKDMARIRTIKPEFWEDAIIGGLSREARLLFIASWNLADDEGILRWSPHYLKASAFIYDADIDIERVRQLMDELTDAGLLHSYFSDRGQQSFAYIANFCKHQVISRPLASRLPRPPKAPNVPQGTLHEDSVVAHGGLHVGSGSGSGSGMEGNGSEEKVERFKCMKCEDKGFWPHKGHLGKMVECHCRRPS